MTEGVIAILEEILKDREKPLYGLETAYWEGLRPSSAYPILERLETAGWLTAW
jgi:DNA-binding PadR family transcriptional regulator